MKLSLPILVAAFFLPTLAHAKEWAPCQPKPNQDIQKTADRFVFACGKGKAAFTAVCDVSSDPVESGKGWLDIKTARWARHGANEGIEGEFGFIVCKKI